MGYVLYKNKSDLSCKETMSKNTLFVQTAQLCLQSNALYFSMMKSRVKNLHNDFCHKRHYSLKHGKDFVLSFDKGFCHSANDCCIVKVNKERAVTCLNQCHYSKPTIPLPICKNGKSQIQILPIVFIGPNNKITL